MLWMPNFKGPDPLEQSEQCLNCYILHKNHPLCKQSRKTLLGLTQIDSVCWVNFHSLLSSANWFFTTFSNKISSWNTNKVSNSFDPDQAQLIGLTWVQTVCMLFCRLIFFQNLINSSRNTISVSNSLDPDEARRFVGPDLGPNCLQTLSADDTSM